MPTPTVWQRLRPLLGLAALLSAFGFAAYTWHRRPVASEVVLVLAHADRAHLTDLSWRVAGERAGEAIERGTLHFAAGTAPEATPPIGLHLPRVTDFVEVQIECVFATPSGGQITTRRQLRATLQVRQTLDIGGCCEGCD